MTEKPAPKLHPQSVIDWLAFARKEGVVDKATAMAVERQARFDARKLGITLRPAKRWVRPVELTTRAIDARVIEATRLIALDDAMISGNLSSATRQKVERFIAAETEKRLRAARFTTKASKKGVEARASKRSERDHLICTLAATHGYEGVHIKREIQRVLGSDHSIFLSQKQIGRVLKKAPVAR